MSLSIYNARLLDPASGLDETGAILIDRGKIKEIANGQTEPHADATNTIDAAGLCLAPGLIDLRVKTGEPGIEQKETLATASRSAVAGGITSFVVMPDTRPVIDDMALVRFVADTARANASARIYPAGALTTGLDGNAMAEIGLMAQSGAVLFTNGDMPVANASILKRTMAYAASLGASIMSRPDERSLSGSGVMNAGELAGRMGLPGIPVEAEWIGAMRDTALAEATGCTLILDQVSTPRTVAIAMEARKRGAKVFTTAAAHSFFFNELDVGDYLTYCKVNPPFRDEETRLGLIDALKNGLIDAVVSAHDPQPPEEKRLPFGEAAFGAAGLETVLPAMLSLVHDGPLSLLEALAPITCRPADMLGLPQGRLAKNAPADVILFDPGKPWLCEREHLRSRSTNSPFDGRRLQGRVLRTFVGGEEVFAHASLA
ncbi:amidohydrolase family protein [Hyphomonas jannaschiana]|uniref:Putative dihydroorotase n=1 Tax=Hyphomonas jannaschiana VP2 TaxID=1280952 RepID=A0A059FAW1_9PROT|nr:amidohydrolase family protein [Hyphomonas jannaschiana]KCZ87668.1 putative dihydroorotase [Hyphomonas jannaschiana VP2]